MPLAHRRPFSETTSLDGQRLAYLASLPFAHVPDLRFIYTPSRQQECLQLYLTPSSMPSEAAGPAWRERECGAMMFRGVRSVQGSAGPATGVARLPLAKEEEVSPVPAVESLPRQR